MKVAKSVIRPAADQDIDDIADDLADHRGIDAGIEFLREFYKTLGLISTHPQMGWPCRLPQFATLANVRVFRVRKPFEKHLIFYLLVDDRIEVLRVLHGSRDLEELLAP